MGGAVAQKFQTSPLPAESVTGKIATVAPRFTYVGAGRVKPRYTGTDCYSEAGRVPICTSGERTTRRAVACLPSGEPSLGVPGSHRALDACDRRSNRTRHRFPLRGYPKPADFPGHHPFG
jgi:hypothetical protein